jgi:AcrR family transcriptional regulator
MGRPASDVDQRLLKAGVELLREGGLDALDVRAVCRRAKANPGLFHYYFKTKRGFVDKAMAEAYEIFFEALDRGVASKTAPAERLEEALVVLGIMAHRHRALLGSLNQAAVRGPKSALGKAMALQVQRLSRHMDELLAAWDQGKAGDRAFNHMFLVENALGGPFVWSVLDQVMGAERRPSLLSPESLDKNAFSESAIRRRVKLSMAALER